MDTTHLSAPSAPAITPDMGPVFRDDPREPVPYAPTAGPAATIRGHAHIPSSERPSQRVLVR